MSINTGEIGVGLNLWVEFDMSAGGAVFALELTDPTGTVVAEKVPVLNTSIVTVPDEVIDEDTGLPMVDFPANESVLYTTISGDFSVAGIWRAVIRYTETGGNVLRSKEILIGVD